LLQIDLMGVKACYRVGRKLVKTLRVSASSSRMDNPTFPQQTLCQEVTVLSGRARNDGNA
jgi:hypothetical protein